MKKRGFTIIEVLVSLALVSLIVLFLLPLFQQQFSFFKRIEETKELHYIKEQLWEEVIAGVREKNENIKGKYDIYTINIHSVPIEDEMEFVKIRIKGEKHGKEEQLEGYVEKKGFFSF